MKDFEPKEMHKLRHLSDEELVAYIGSANRAGDLHAEREALNLLAFDWEPRIRVWVESKVPAQDVGDVVVDVLEALTRTSYEGKTIGRFGGFMRGVTHNKIVDYHRAAKRRGKHSQAGTGQEGDDDPVFVPSEGEVTGTIDVLEAVERVLSSRSDLHREVLHLYGAGVAGFRDLPAREVAERLDAEHGAGTMTEANVNQIFRRFKVDLESELGG